MFWIYFFHLKICFLTPLRLYLYQIIFIGETVYMYLCTLSINLTMYTYVLRQNLWLFNFENVHIHSIFMLDCPSKRLFMALLSRAQTRVKKQETKRFSTFVVYRLHHSETKKIIAWFENHVLAEHLRNSQSTIYLKSYGCAHGFQNEVSLINFSTMFC